MSQPSQSHIKHVIAGDRATLAKRYASALFDLADEKKALEPVASDMKALQEAIDADTHFHAMASHPRLPIEKVEEVTGKIADVVKFHAVTKTFLVHLAHNRRLVNLPDIIEAFQADLAEKKGQHVAFITAAHTLTSEQEAALSAQLGKMVGGTVRLMVEKDESLLGGLIIKLGSRLIDASVKGKLAQAKRQLKTKREAA